MVKFIPEEAGPLPRGKGTVSDVTAAAALARPDLPDTLQVGVNIYSDSQPGLQVRYENIRVESVTGETDCTLDS